MHRSGTSLITRWLQACGLHVGSSLLGPQTGNAEGHFEDNDFVHLHQQLLKFQKLPHTGLTNRSVESIPTQQETVVQTLVALKSTLHDQWGWKDPRTCLFLNTYRKLLPAARYIIILRNCQYVVSSLLNRDHQGLNRYYLSKGNVYRFFLRMKKKYNKNWLYKTYAKKYLEIWIAYNEELLKHIEAIPPGSYIAMDYLSLLDDDKYFFKYLVDEWGLSMKYVGFKTLYKEQLISQSINIAALISDVSLLAKAQLLENRLYSTLLRH